MEQLPLRDIHLPAEPGWWPPAPGWGLLLVLLVVLGCAALWWQRRRQRHNRSARVVARRELEKLRGRLATEPAEQIVRELSALLRRLAISIYPRQEAAGLTGADWLGFLDRGVEEKVFSTGPGRLLIEAPYRPRVQAGELGPLFDACRAWIDTAGARS